MNDTATIDMFDPRYLARSTDPETSHQAARGVHEFAGAHIDIVLACLKAHGPQTIDEIAKRTALTSVQVARRLPDAQKRGWAQPSGAERLSASGRLERVWRAIA